MDSDGHYLHYPVDRYLDEFSGWVEWSDICLEQWHRPLSSYMGELLAHGLTLTFSMSRNHGRAMRIGNADIGVRSGS
jgi:hypothetical protein